MKQPKKHITSSFFLDHFFKEKCFPPFLKKINNSILNSSVYEATDDNEEKLAYSTYSVYDVPDYFTLDYKNNNSYLKILKTPLYKGFLIDLSVFKNIEDYLDNKLGKPRKSQLKRYRKRLDKCINPKYKIFYGNISKDDYDLIFKNLIILTERRFAQKEELNFELPFLELYKEIMYPMVLNKKASIFVIYHESKTINITLNFIDKSCVFHWNSCYDIDYQMFNLGHINMVNHLKWSFDNGFKLFDMGRGDFLHKRKYINKSYNYMEHIIYNSNLRSASIRAHFNISKLKLRYLLIKNIKKLNLHLWYGKFAKFKYRALTPTKNTNKTSVIKTSFISKITDIDKLTLVDLNKGEHNYLIKPLNYFSYKSQNYVGDIKIYSQPKDYQTFYFKGSKSIQKVIINHEVNSNE